MYAWEIEFEASKRGRGAYRDIDTYWIKYGSLLSFAVVFTYM